MTGTGPLELRYRPIVGFAPLAWCAEVRRDESVVEVVHGSLVETSPGAWFEGVWDGPFAAWTVASCATTMGSGAVVEDRALHVVAPSHTYESVCCLRGRDRVWLSNSIACAFAVAGDGPRVDHPWYHRDLLALQRRGITGARPLVLPTARGHRLELHAATDVLVDPTLRVRTTPRPQPPGPDDFAHYRDLLASTLGRLVDNARDPGRARPLRVATTTSTGYDSTASSALAAEAGVRDAITFDRDRRGVPADCGREIAERLGLEAHVYDTGAWRRRPGCPELEFVATTSGWAMLPVSAIADDWAGAAVVMGNLGDDLWRVDRQDVGAGLARPHEQEPAAAGLREFRLHAGIALVHLPTVGAIHAAAIHRISRSAELEPWRVHTAYDRPIPRRIVEEAGVPRAAFGQVAWNTIDVQSPELAARLRSTTFPAYVEAAIAQLRGPERWWLAAEWHGGAAAVDATARSAARWWGRAHRFGVAPLARAMQTSVATLTRWQWHRSRLVQYTFHWANHELAQRYRVALDGAGESATRSDRSATGAGVRRRG